MKKAPTQRIVANLGLAQLHSVVTQMGYVWRPTPNDDYGIDGEIEIVEDNVPTARILKVQLKSGRSYFRSERDRTFEFHVDPDDIEYWSNANTPVLLVLYHPDRDRLYWIHVQRYLEEIRLHAPPIGSPLTKGATSSRLTRCHVFGRLYSRTWRTLDSPFLPKVRISHHSCH